ncbi:alpha/beta hydrolase [Autumnicola musiva]|uniref:Alpha/beta fold hydrolase n=1 Tax=Autumnicola musiva TaxID=3075589 RepID=A0ABU3D5L9_9FLAO|nr:alpha/beta fold hydrolase [Zunongwangia sp. F117]MDT0676830.1 alpha/beta fold hydrolase [Zunongwangia sp. F117]
MNTSNLSLYHIVKEPLNKHKKSPLLIMLHGYGSNEEDLFAFANELPEDLFIISVRAPFPMQPYGNAWYAIHWNNTDGKFSDEDQARDSREKIAGFIDEAIAAYPVDPKNVTLLGFSQGSILSYAVSLSYPEKVKNIIALSGYINQDIVKESFENNDFSHLSFYSSHGSQDQVIPVEWARNTKPFLNKLNIENTYSEFPVGHGVAPQNFFEVKEWIKNKI